MTRNELEQRYFSLGNELPKLYPEKNFDNHCYWRIALDNTIGDKWKKQVNSPAYKNLSDAQLEEVVSLLEKYKDDETALMQDNQRSLKWRKTL
jgi:hypothetical protein